MLSTGNSPLSELLFVYILRKTSHTGCREGGLFLAQNPDTWLCFPHSILTFHSRKKCLGGGVGKDPNAGQEMEVCILGLSWVNTVTSHHSCLKVHPNTAHSKGQLGACTRKAHKPKSNFFTSFMIIVKKQILLHKGHVFKA